ncbi:AbiV family abortive infection protein [Flavobacterium sp.]|uniref:AbiV family abortive infection protein n=1 Tax=Flavobacterium sp. TaxID=239 RepID=UPI0039E29FDB
MPITEDNLLEAVEKAIQNAQDLYEEAIILKNHGKIARAYTLFQFSIEEIGKASMTFHFAMHGNLENEKDCSKFLRNFRDHKIKTEVAQGIDFMFVMISESSEFTKSILQNFLEKNNKLSLNLSNDKKNYSLYTSFIKKKFYKPNEVILAKDLDEIESYANLRLKIARPFFNLGIKNFGLLLESKHLLNEEEAIEEGVTKLKKLLEL